MWKPTKGKTIKFILIKWISKHQLKLHIALQAPTYSRGPIPFICRHQLAKDTNPHLFVGTNLQGIPISLIFSGNNLKETPISYSLWTPTCTATQILQMGSYEDILHSLIPFYFHEDHISWDLHCTFSLMSLILLYEGIL